MIQNIQFPEGTVVKYQRGSILDQFSPGINLNYNPVYGGGTYEFSQLYSAREYTGNLDYCFKYSNCYFKITETPSSIKNTFEQGLYYFDIVFDKNTRITNADAFLSNSDTKSFMSVSANISGSVTNFMSYTPVKYLDWDIDTSSWSSTYIFGHQLVAMNGYFSMASYNNVSYYALTGFTKAANLRKFTIKDLGTKSSFTTGDFTYWDIWGINHSSVPDARQSLIDSLITYSFDRAAAGYSKCTIKLSAKTKAILTEEEIAQITAKGFTIA